MRINKLTLEGFRNYRGQTLEFDPACNVIHGENAQGKTNLLEAMVYLSCGKSPRTRTERELISFDGGEARIIGEIFSREREFITDITLRAGSRRKMTVNGVAAKNASELSEVLHTVFFSPEDLFLIREGAAARRRFMDQSLCQLRPRYAHRLYEHKTRILRDREENPGLLAMLPDFNEGMCRMGAILIHYRAQYCRALDGYAAPAHGDCSGGREKLKLRYETVKTVVDPFAKTEDIAQNLRDHQQSHYHAELASGLCLSGPHKDDFLVEVNGRSARQFCSQGQVRTAALSLGDTPQRRGGVPGDAAGRCALGAGPQAAGICIKPHFRGTGVHYLLRKRQAGPPAGGAAVSHTKRGGGFMSYLHIGQNAMLPEKRIIGIFDLDITSQSKRTREFLEKAEQEGVVVPVTEDIPKSFLVCDHPYHRQIVYISQLNTQTLQKRSRGE